MKKVPKNYRTPTIEQIQRTPNTDDLFYFKRYEVTLVPENNQDLNEIDERLKDRNSVEHPHRPGFAFELDNNEVTFQTIRVPSVLGDLTELNTDEELKGKFVQVVGHIQTPLNKDPFISFHMIESAFNPLDGFNPFDDGVERYLSERIEHYSEDEKRKIRGLTVYRTEEPTNSFYEWDERKKSDHRSRMYKPSINDFL